MVYTSVMIKLLKLFFAFIIAGFYLTAGAQTPAEYQANYEKRIKMEMISGVYIPVDLNDAFSELDRLADPVGLSKFKMAPDSAIEKSHFGLAQWVQRNWGLDEGSRLSAYMKSKGVSVPDDMARVIVITYHRHLIGQPLMLEQEVALIEKRMAAEKAKRDSLSVIISDVKKPHKE
jgi:hypothetical protein